MNVFDEHALAYDNSIDWKSRLDREIPFILRSVPRTCSTVLDIACGSGRHAVELAKRGFEVSAFDNSATMIKIAQDLAMSEHVDVKFHVLSMQEMVRSFSGSQFDAISCFGNSLALLESFEEFKLFIQHIHELLLPTGVFVFQTLNFEAVEEQGIRFMPTKKGTLRSGENVTFSRFIDYTQGDNERASLVISSVLEQKDAKPVVRSQDVLRITGPLIEEACKSAGFVSLEMFSDYSSHPFQREYDRNIVGRARR